MKTFKQFINESKSLTTKDLEDMIENGGLSLNNKGLNELPELPNSLQELSCRDNQLNELPELPNNLQKLWCYNNQLTELPELPENLKELWCSNNQLNELPELPNSLQRLYCFNNPFNEPLKKWIHDKFELEDLYSKELIVKFKSFEYQDWYLSEYPWKYDRLEIFGYNDIIKDKYKNIFSVKRAGII